MSAGGLSRSAFNVAENVPVRRISASVRANNGTRAHRASSPPVGGTAKQEDKPRRRFGQLRQRERLSLSNHTQRERIPSPTTHEAHEDAAVALNKLSTAVS